MTDTILVPGETCVAVARAERLALIVDAADFFVHAKAAMLAAERSILLVGWDFDARIDLEPEGQTLRGPNAVGRFLEWLANDHPHLSVRILKWDIGLLRSLSRGETPAYLINWSTRSIDFRLDHAHHPTSAQHMKLLVVDDRLAFCGGIDMTVGRWDTSEHEEGRPGRRTPRGAPLGPWHDATSCVSGDAARVLAEVARDRWYWATGERLEPVDVAGDPWPDALVADFEGVDVGIARTLPKWRDRPQATEILAATYATIRAARTVLYVESQYLASRRVVEVIAERLDEPDGPEVIVINPDSADGWLEKKAMDTARVRMLRLLAEADRHDRLRVYYPVNAAGTPIYVHAKVMFADDRVLKIGSANINNRSMGFDSECDLVVDVGDDDARRAGVRAIRDRLVAEHLGRSAAEVAAEFARQGGSLLRTVDALNATDRARLVPLRPRELSFAEELFAESDAADPIRPVGIAKLLRSLMRRTPNSIRRTRRRLRGAPALHAPSPSGGADVPSRGLFRVPD